MFSYMKRGKGFYKDLFSLALPMMIQNLIMTGLAMVDIFMVGLLGEAPMAAVTLANTPIFVIQLLVFGVQSGSAVLISQFWGKQDRDSINRVMGIAFCFTGAVSTIFALITFLIPQHFMSLFSDNALLVGISAKYIRIAGASYIFNSLVGVYVGAHRSMENPKLGLMIFGCSMLINTFLNWVLIFGKLGAPAMGVEGAALATLLARVAELILMLVYESCNRRFRMNLSLAFSPNRAMLKKFLRYSTPVVLNETLWGLGTSIFPTIMGHMENSTEILAAYTIAGNIEKLCTVAIFALAGTAAVIIGREIGKGRMDESYEVGATLCATSVMLGLGIGCIMLLLLYMFIEPVVYPLFGLSPLACRFATVMQTVTYIFLAPRAFNSTAIVGVLRGGGDVRAATVIDITPLWLVAIPLTALCGLVLKTDIMWVCLSMVSENLVKFGLGIWRFRSRKWINDITQAATDNTETAHEPL